MRALLGSLLGRLLERYGLHHWKCNPCAGRRQMQRRQTLLHRLAPQLQKDVRSQPYHDRLALGAMNKRPRDRSRRVTGECGRPEDDRNDQRGGDEEGEPS